MTIKREYFGFCGYLTVDEFFAENPKKFTSESLDRILTYQQVNKRGRRCKSCDKMVKFDVDGNKAWFYRLVASDCQWIGSYFMPYEDFTFCSKECTYKFMESVVGDLDQFLEEFNKNYEKHVKEMVEGITSKAIEEGRKPFRETH